ncbi:MAG: hypothetical protein LBQ54_01905 [Planctomycetaceae bacterium]|nr:hypothetical protein [Planctomycetaceae bacterium]
MPKSLLPEPIVTAAEIAALKDSAIYAEKAAGLSRNRMRFTVRILVVGGLMTAEKLRAAATLANRYGNGTLHLTTRQGFEIPHVPYQKLPLLRKALEKSPLESARSGKCVRAIVACPGTYCKFGTIDTQGLADALFKKFGKRKNLPHKFKIAVAGCRHCCSKPQINDLGIMGSARGFEISVGGMSGKSPRWGDKLPIPAKNKTELLRLIKLIIDWYAVHGNDKERFGAAIDRISFPRFLEDIQTVS